jgi:hypothetical protein
VGRLGTVCNGDPSWWRTDVIQPMSISKWIISCQCQPQVEPQTVFTQNANKNNSSCCQNTKKNWIHRILPVI